MCIHFHNYCNSLVLLKTVKDTNTKDKVDNDLNVYLFVYFNDIKIKKNK